jgi:hypothetical protein
MSIVYWPSAEYKTTKTVSNAAIVSGTEWDWGDKKTIRDSSLPRPFELLFKSPVPGKDISATGSGFWYQSGIAVTPNGGLTASPATGLSTYPYMREGQSDTYQVGFPTTIGAIGFLGRADDRITFYHQAAGINVVFAFFSGSQYVEHSLSIPINSIFVTAYNGGGPGNYNNNNPGYYCYEVVRYPKNNGFKNSIIITYSDSSTETIYPGYAPAWVKWRNDTDCPEGTCKCDCGDHYCCFGATGRPVLEIPKL